ncbi:unnamed protein product [Prorocentrum cordatum]|uniref:Uncharacterized protein n=1 Tax=Prorocentrum cordatum TaxID=2364126 RepID=A0ABN9XPJ4_9DINO|nr:unnamed protein product [Polarella glacialis]
MAEIFPLAPSTMIIFPWWRQPGQLPGLQRFLQKDGAVLRYQEFCAVTRCGSNPGGLQASLAAGRRGLEERAAASLLAAEFPLLLRLTPSAKMGLAFRQLESERLTFCDGSRLDVPRGCFGEALRERRLLVAWAPPAARCRRGAAAAAEDLPPFLREPCRHRWYGLPPTAAFAGPRRAEEAECCRRGLAAHLASLVPRAGRARTRRPREAAGRRALPRRGRCGRRPSGSRGRRSLGIRSRRRRRGQAGAEQPPAPVPQRPLRAAARPEAASSGEESDGLWA